MFQTNPPIKFQSATCPLFNRCFPGTINPFDGQDVPVFLVYILSGLFVVIGRILETVVEVILARPFCILGLVGLLSSEPKCPAGRCYFIGLAILGVWYAIQELNNLPFQMLYLPIY
jgi:hypothetical protein